MTPEEIQTDAGSGGWLEPEVTLSWRVTAGQLSCRPADGRPLGVTRIFGSVVVNGGELHLASATENSRMDRDAEGRRRVVTSFRFAEPSLCWSREVVEDGPGLTIRTRLENTGEVDLIIGDWHVLDASASGGVIDLGAEPEQVRFFGWRSWHMQVERFAEESSRHPSNNLCHLYDPASGLTLLSSFVSLDRMLVRHELHYVRGRGVTHYRATCRAGRFRLRPGRMLQAETLQLSYHNNPYAALENWADRIKARYTPELDERPMVIWSGGAWIDPFSDGEDNWATVALDNARALRDKLAGFEVTHIWTSQMDLGEGLPGNWLTGNEEQIPGGMPAFVARLKALGFGHKLWFSPFWFFAEAKGILEENRENLLRDAEGNPITEPGRWEWDYHIDPEGSLRLTKYFLDGTHPKTRAYVAKIFKAYRAMGASACMLDFLAIREDGCLYDDTLLPVEAARKILAVVREAFGEEAHLQTAVASTPGFVGLLNAARVGRDFGEGRPLYPPFPLWHNATYVRHDLHFGNTHYFVQNAAANWFTHGKVYGNDLNILTVDKPVPLEHARIATTLFGLSGGSPLTLGDDFRTIDPERLRLVKLCLPRTSGVPTPVDLFEHVSPEAYGRILKLQVRTPWEDYLLVAVYNGEGASYDASLDLVRLGLDGESAYRVFEFWNEEYIGTFRGSFPCAVPPEAIRLYRLAPARTHPWLLSTDMHLQQGAVEILSLSWDEETKILAGIATRPAGEHGNLFVHLPRPYRLVNHKEVGLMKEVRDMTVVARVPIAFQTEKTAFALRFDVLDVPNVAWRGWLPYCSEAEWKAYVEEHRPPGDTRVLC